ncbi:MAG: GP88 family protein [bacterium]
MMELLVYGNDKLGAIANFSLPAMKTCPGKTKFCKRFCYGQRNWYRTERVKQGLWDRYFISLSPQFADRVIGEIKDKKIKLVRIHTVGDFYSVEYIKKWEKIARACAGSTKFYGYTRSWRVDELRPHLEYLMENFLVWLRASIDYTTHQQKPEGWATFSSVDGDGKLCPHDSGKVMFCRDCGICWNSFTPIYTRVKWATQHDNFSEELI